MYAWVVSVEPVCYASALIMKMWSPWHISTRETTHLSRLLGALNKNDPVGGPTGSSKYLVPLRQANA